ncbi:MAG: hypothetical protein ABIA04_05885 [Pseudomonadota bacterium]
MRRINLFTTIYFNLAFLSLVWADPCPMNDMPRRSFSMDSNFDAMTITENLYIEDDPPVEAIGKVTGSNISSSTPICSAALINSDLIIVPTKCIEDRGGKYFWPDSNDEKPSPHGGAKITQRYIDSYSGIAFAKLDKSFYLETFNWRCLCKGSSFHQSWRNGAYWLLGGYEKDDDQNPDLEAGITVESISGGKLNSKFSHSEFNVSYEEHLSDKYLIIDDKRSLKKFRNGAVFFGYLCGDWSIIGMKVNDYDSVTHLKAACPMLYHSYDYFGYSWKAAQSCPIPGKKTIERRSPFESNYWKNDYYE